MNRYPSLSSFVPLFLTDRLSTFFLVSNSCRMFTSFSWSFSTRLHVQHLCQRFFCIAALQISFNSSTVRSHARITIYILIILRFHESCLAFFTVKSISASSLFLRRAVSVFLCFFPRSCLAFSNGFIILPFREAGYTCSTLSYHLATEHPKCCWKSGNYRISDILLGFPECTICPFPM